ncbi:MAG TPA: hypothetical protein VK858_15680 [Longimicrobiales bacterium]|nr:hypothetical protein [Longimicrobiales bacterium]
MRIIGFAVVALLLAQVPPVTAQKIETRRISISGVWANGVSYDGRYVSTTWAPEAPWAVSLLDLATGELEQLTPVLEEGDVAYPSWAQVSRDGSRVAYTYFNGSTRDLYVVDRKGDRRVLLEGLDADLYPSDWTPDGRHVVMAAYGVDRSNGVMLVSVEDGSSRMLASYDIRWPGLPRISPDGRYVAYDFPEDVDALDRDVWVVPIVGGDPVKVVESGATDILLGWLPDGSGLLFQSDRDGTDGWWTLAMDGGRPSGRPHLVNADVWGKPTPIGMTEELGLVYTVTVGRQELFVAGFDEDAVEVNGTLRRISGNYPVWGQRRMAWSPDGDRIVFISRTGNPGWGTGRDKLVVWSAGTGELREVVPGASAVPQVTWDPGGHSFIATAVSQSDQGLYRIDARSGSLTPILTGEWPNYFHLSSDGRTGYFQRVSGRQGVVAIDLASGEVRDLYVEPEGASTELDAAYAYSGLALSHDERTLLLGSFGRDQVLALPTSGGTPRVVVSLGEGETLAALRWATSDGSAFVTTRTQGSDRLDLWRFSLTGGDRQHVATCSEPTEPAPCLGEVSPDGRRIAFGVGKSSAETWVARAFPSAVAGGGGLFRR